MQSPADESIADRREDEPIEYVWFRLIQRQSFRVARRSEDGVCEQQASRKEVPVAQTVPLVCISATKPRICTHVSACILFPAASFTTKDLVRTYEALAPVLLPHLAGRPLSLKRYPEDIEGDSYWKKDAPSFTPKWVERMPVPGMFEPFVHTCLGFATRSVLHRAGQRLGISWGTLDH